MKRAVREKRRLLKARLSASLRLDKSLAFVGLVPTSGREVPLDNTRGKLAN